MICSLLHVNPVIHPNWFPLYDYSGSYSRNIVNYYKSQLLHDLYILLKMNQEKKDDPQMYDIQEYDGVLHINHCDKDGTAILKRIASYAGKISSTLILGDGRKPTITPNYLEECSRKIVQLYKLENIKTVVLGSCHQTSLYIAQLLNAPLFSLQFIGYCKDLSQIEKLKCCKIIGCDYDFTNLCWVWTKISSKQQIPESYKKILKQSQNCVLVRSCSKFRIQGNTDKCLGKLNVNTYVHSSIKLWKNRPQNMEQNLQKPNEECQKIRQWEFGLPDNTLLAIKQYWQQIHPDKKQNFIIIQEETVQLYKLIPYLFIQYYHANKLRINGISLNPYYTLHPYYEKKVNIVPFVFYNFRVLQKYFQSIMDKIKDEINITKQTVICWANMIEKEKDLNVILQFWKKNGLQNGWFSIGLDCIKKRNPPLKCTDVFGSNIPAPHQKVKQWLSKTQYKESKPMQFKELVDWYRNWLQTK